MNMHRRSDDRPDSLTVFFPVYNDEHTIERVTHKAIQVCEFLTDDYEILIVNDGSPDRSGELADELAANNERVTAIHHETNLGYGAAVRTGLAASNNTWICFTDGDDEYDLHDLKKLWRLRNHYGLVITFRYVRRYSGMRVFISRVYNRVLRRLFHTDYRDISTGLRLVKKDVVDKLNLTATSPFIGAEITIKTMLMGYPVGEVGIQTFPREIGRGGSTSVANIRKTIADMLRTRRRIFSENYQLPESGERSYHDETGNS
ncbi:MAG: glycosyltransferase involved in cell wall biosynthesis [Candidatus Aldehydirespiratoraceae bacterium]|jgi:glycosyltransferase involved in cell wall biosynthesis